MKRQHRFLPLLLLLFIFLLLSEVYVFGAQYSEPILTKSKSELKADRDSVYYFTDKRAEFPGGTDAMSRFIAKELSYPNDARSKEIEGRVLVRFVIGRNGEVVDPKILGDTNSMLAEEAIRIVSHLPKWVPAEHNGEVVQMYVTVPINFRLH